MKDSLFKSIQLKRIKAKKNADFKKKGTILFSPFIKEERDCSMRPVIRQLFLDVITSEARQSPRLK